MKIKVLVADDHAVVRSGLSMLINAEDDMEVIGTASDGAEALRLTCERLPDVIVMDINMPPGEDGLAATSRIKQAAPNAHILILTMHDDQEYLFRALEAGASGYVLKNAQEMDVMDAIRTVSAGEAYLSPKSTTMLIQKFMRQSQVNPTDRAAMDELSNREREVVGLIAKGFSNKEIAESLYISVKTVEAHRSKVMEKLKLRTRSELVSYAIQQGYLDV